jgi:polysaccharide biosynthesis protein PslG
VLFWKQKGFRRLPGPISLVLAFSILASACGASAQPLSPNYGFAAQVVAGQAAASVKATKEAGFGWLTQQVRWDGLQPTPDATIDWSQLDAAANASSQAGIKMMFSIVAAPAGASSPGAHFPKTPAEFVSFVSQLVTHFKGRVQAYEIWNEENFATEVGPGHIDAGQYVELLKAAYPAIKAIDPTVTVVSGAPTPTGVNDPNIAMDDATYLQQMYAYQDGVVKSYFDVLGAHPEGYANPPEENVANHTQANFSTHSSFFFRRAEDYHNIMAQAGDGAKKMWATESGYDANPQAPAGYEYARALTEAQQADYIVRSIKYARANWPWMVVIFIWNLNFQAVVPQADEKWGFGILNADYSPRPAYTALQKMAK